MNNLCLFLLSAFVSLIAAQEQFSTLIQTGLVTPPGGGRSIQLSYQLANAQVQPVQFFLFPCFGELNLFASINEMPTPSDAGCSVLFDGNDIPFYNCNFPQTQNPAIYNLLVTGNEDYLDRTPAQSGMFDLLATNNTFDQAGRLPTPANNGEVSLDLDSDGTATISFTPTGNPADVYRVWTLEGSIPDGAVLQTGCGVQAVMTQLDSAIFNLAEGTAQFNINNNVRTTAVIVVERQNVNMDGYIAAYSVATFNSGSLLTPTFAFAFVFYFLFF
eukprot:TRINITY_DN38325_c0_g1_i1.p1 TRINITY_DN38325_c0_g1~~TRINITY_DN38325_c0_g1_i1.p1  ORF type:complete len:273 (+),score=30.63 TRINITY_DN38325_c0_g1_i1:2-820(+)